MTVLKLTREQFKQVIATIETECLIEYGSTSVFYYFLNEMDNERY